MRKRKPEKDVRIKEEKDVKAEKDDKGGKPASRDGKTASRPRKNGKGSGKATNKDDPNPPKKYRKYRKN